jgi:hypothetical protein
MKRSWLVLVMTAAAGMALAACGSSSPTASSSSPPATTSTAPVTSTHTAAGGEPRLVAVTGYDYANPKGKASKVCDAMMQLFNSSFVTGCGFHEVTGGQGRMILFQLSLSDQVMQNVPAGSMEQNMMNSLAGQGVKGHRMMLSGKPVYWGRVANGQGTIYAWTEGGTILVVESQQAADGKQFVSKYIAAA